jgi:CheY-like chemotaxis protein
MHLQSLLLSHDTEVARVLRPALEKLSIEMETCGESEAAKRLAGDRFDAVIVDCDDLQSGLQMLHGIRQSPGNRRSIAFALLNGTTTISKAFQYGANFVLQKPISLLNATRCFSAALGLMERERRRYFRHAVQFKVAIVFADGTKKTVTASNISEGGMAIRLEERLPQDKSLDITFTLPRMQFPVSTRAEIAWSSDIYAGLRFMQLPTNMREQLEHWLQEQMSKTKS